MAVGNTIAFLENGVQRISVADRTLSGGAPGIMAHGAAEADNWSGGDTGGFQVSYQGTDAQGVRSYNVLSDSNGYGTQRVRVLPPAKPTRGLLTISWSCSGLIPGRLPPTGTALQPCSRSTRKTAIT